MQKKMMKSDEIGKLSCGIYSCPAASASFARLGQQSLDKERLGGGLDEKKIQTSQMASQTESI